MVNIVYIETYYCLVANFDNCCSLKSKKAEGKSHYICGGNLYSKVIGCLCVCVSVCVPRNNSKKGLTDSPNQKTVSLPKTGNGFRLKKSGSGSRFVGNRKKTLVLFVTVTNFCVF